jgi:tetratricopeptide (TPR) repeat protein
VNELTPATPERTGRTGSVFISYATADRKQALSVCKAIERRGPKCWVSSRNVEPGENYQEAIVRSIRNARAMVLVFSEAANESDEIKKELSLASRYRVPVMALRIEDVEPSDAFAYELSTRQWIDAFEGWDRSIDSLVSRIGQISDAEPAAITAAKHASRRSAFFSRRPIWIAVTACLVLLVMAAGAWWVLRPPPAAAHSMMVRLAGFQLLSTDLPATMRDAVGSEITTAFNADGVIGVSAASAPPPGSAPAYALGGTIRRDGDTIRVITRLTNERSGATLWSDSFNYDGNEVSKVPRHIAVDAGNVVRCGLFGASTYRKALPDPVLRDYMQFCQGHWDPYLEDGRKALVPAQRVVAAAPGFSWGWAAVAGGFWKVAQTADDNRLSEQARASGRQAADRALAIDDRNSEALWIKSLLIDQHDWIGRESLLKRAVAARSLDCGCEHHQYGEMLLSVGRITEAVEQLRQANDMLALYVYTPLSLADALVAAGKPEQAKPLFDAAIELAPDLDFAKNIAVYGATETGDTKTLLDAGLPMSAELRTALLKGYRAVASRDSGAKPDAVRALLALPESQQDDAVARLLADLGADHEAFRIASRLAAREYPGPSVFWYPNMRGVLNDPGFPAAAKQLGLISYWRESQTKPDVCLTNTAPPFCRAI